ncbi:hypothetical protein [Streptomyces sp. NBC_01198]|uniref:hypothetical protein n=1 Tax=Streptomyces sp. NBC_01198 TaxID=2903769 RepID=UPI002E135177|nr:hypothetical protein OG702_11435 [Streptomyces sp. NBC_01198]
MRRALGAAAFTAAALCLTCLPATATATSAPAPAPATATAAPAHHPAPPPQARVWLTTADDSVQLQPQAPVAFHPGASDLTTITVDPNRSLQRMDGFGGAMTDSSAAVLSSLPRGARDAAMRKLFDPRSDDGTHWRTAATGAGTGQLTTVDLRSARARYVRVTQTATSPNWWSLADLRLYR